uniref:Uncharacterized protein n=1 Tax=Picocystis salinarum TaxID=88271 RepID=A0A6U9RKR2_9CHLO
MLGSVSPVNSSMPCSLARLIPRAHTRGSALGFQHVLSLLRAHRPTVLLFVPVLPFRSVSSSPSFGSSHALASISSFHLRLGNGNSNREPRHGRRDGKVRRWKWTASETDMCR